MSTKTRCARWILPLALVLAAQAADVTGRWTVDNSNKPNWRITLHQDGAIVGATKTLRIQRADLQNLTTPQGPARFTLVRDAGTIHFQGTFSQNTGSGTFRFTENQAFVDALKSIATGWSDPTRLYTMALTGVTLNELHRLQDAAVPNLTAFDVQRRHDLSTFDPLERSRLKANNVDPEYVRKIQQKYPVSTDEAIRLHQAGIDAQMVDALHRAGNDVLPVSDMLKLKTYGVTTHDIQKLDQLGMRNLTPDEIVKMKVEGTLP
jgi:hypothetical protein